jgi:ABC-2 type transport system permease protein
METEFRFSFVLWIFVNILWGTFRFLTVFLLFNTLGDIAGWSKEQALILSVISSITMSLLWVFVLPNLVLFPEMIRKGDLDFVLLKPVNTRFLVSTRYFEFDQVGRLIVAPILLVILIGQFHMTVSLVNIVSCLVVMFAGIVTIYNAYFFVTTLSFWLVSVENMQNLLFSFNDAGQYPSQIFKGGIKVFFYFVIPVIFISTFPTQVLLGKTGLIAVPISLLGVVISSAISECFWNFALKRYSSASS